jgi:hypothetical protein
MMVIHQVESNNINKGLWIELNEEQTEQINGGRISGVNINTNIAVQTNVATVIGDNAFISQYNSFWKK